MPRVLLVLPNHQRVYWVYLRPVGMVSVQNIRARDRDVLAWAWNWDLVRIVLACRYRVCLARRIHTDNLDHKITVIRIPFITAVCEVTVSLIQIQSQVNITVNFLYTPVYCPGSS